MPDLIRSRQQAAVEQPVKNVTHCDYTYLLTSLKSLTPPPENTISLNYKSDYVDFD